MRMLTQAELLIAKELLTLWLTVGVMVMVMDYLIVGNGGKSRSK